MQRLFAERHIRHYSTQHPSPRFPKGLPCPEPPNPPARDSHFGHWRLPRRRHCCSQPDCRAQAQSFTQSGANNTTGNPSGLPFVGNPASLNFGTDTVYIANGAPGSFSALAGAQLTAGALIIANGGVGGSGGDVIFDGTNPATAARTTVLAGGHYGPTIASRSATSAPARSPSPAVHCSTRPPTLPLVHHLLHLHRHRRGIDCNAERQRRRLRGTHAGHHHRLVGGIHQSAEHLQFRHPGRHDECLRQCLGRRQTDD